MEQYMDLKLLKAARKGDVEQIKKVSNDERKNINDQTTPEGNTVLHMAARFGHLTSVQEIVKQNSSLALKTNLKAETPLHIAARAGKLEVVKCLINSVEKFSRIRIGSVKDIYGNTPLHGAVRNGHEKVVNELAGLDVESLLLINDAGESPLSIAINMRLSEIARNIIRWNASTLEFTGHNGQTALHYAVKRNDSETTNAILEFKKDLIRIQDETKRTPLHYAAAMGYQILVEKLCKVDPFVAYIGDNNQHTPAHLAAKNGRINVIKVLLEFCPDTIEIIDNKQRNILHLAAETGNLDMVSLILNLEEMDDLINSPDVDGNTPLHLASRNYYIDVVDVLSKNQKVEITATNNSNKTALEIVKLPNDCGMELQKHLTLKVLKSAFKRKGFNPEEILENTQLDDVDVEKGGININDGVEGRILKVENEGKDVNKNGRQIAKMISLMSTLIATFTFTAAFTMPGGFEENEGANQGMAALIRRPSFQAFVIFDALAMTSSITSAAITFWSASIRDAELFMDILSFAIALTWFSLVAVILAFVTGLFAVLKGELWLAILVCATGCLVPFFFFTGPIFLSYARDYKSRSRIMEDIPFLLIIRLMKMFFGSQIKNLFKWMRIPCFNKSCLCCSK